MDLASVSLLFLLQLGAGSIATFAVNDRAALGPKYFKLAGWIVVALYGLAGSLAWPAALAGGAPGPVVALGGAVGVAALAQLGFAAVCGWDRPRAERALLALSLLAALAALALAALRPESIGAPERPALAGHGALVLAGSLGSAAVLGFTTWGMILGHWYLVSQGLSVGHLARLVSPLPWLLAGKAAVSGLALWWTGPALYGPGNASLDELLARHPERVLDVVNVWARIPVGLLVPFVLALMTKVTVRMERTQPATGILYAMCVVVYLGELMGKMVEGGTGVPL